MISPSAPNQIYAKDGWAGHGDWSGLERLLGVYDNIGLLIARARSFVGLASEISHTQWHEFSASGERPNDIPSNPNQTIHAMDGWAGHSDWLGAQAAQGTCDNIVNLKKRAPVRSWGLACSLGLNGERILSRARSLLTFRLTQEGKYANNGWAGMGDWLGTGTVASSLRQYRPFKIARAFVRTLGLKSGQEWSVYCQSGNKPADTRRGRARTYAKDGWDGWGDWLGTGNGCSAITTISPI